MWYMTEDQNMAKCMYSTHRDRQFGNKLVI